MDRPNLAFAGAWTVLPISQASSSTLAASSQPLATIVFSFVGSGVKWIGARGPKHGIAEIRLDDVPQGSIDLYTPQGLAQQTLWEKRDLPRGEHRLTILVTGSKNSLSSDAFVTVDAFDVWLGLNPTSGSAGRQ